MTFMKYAVVGVCLFVAVAAHAESLVFDVPHLKDIEIDGDVSDWGGQGFYVGLLADETREFKPAADFDGRLWLGWDEKGLLIRAEGRDDVYVEHEEDWSIWEKDAVELFMAIEPGSKDRYQIVVAPGHTEEQPDLRIQYYEFRDSEELRAIEMTGDAAASREGDTYTLEVRMPWSNLALEPKPGMTCGFQIYLNDFDPGDPQYLGRYTAMWYPGGQSNWYPERMYTVRLADEPSPPVLAMASAHAFSEANLLWVEVTAVEELAGQTVRVSGPGLAKTALPLEAENGRAGTRVYLETPKADYDPAQVQLATEQAPIDNIATDTEVLPATSFDVALEDGAYIITPRLEPAGQFPADKAAKVALFDQAGRELDHVRIKPGESERLDLDPGAYLLTAEYPRVFGRPISGGLGFAAGYPEDLQERLNRLQALVDTASEGLDDEILSAYQGYWLFRLAMAAECAAERPEEFAEEEAGFVEWLIRPQVNPNALVERRGTFEWAYRSNVDGSGQPFMVTVPHGYDGNAPIPACLSLHGSGGTHIGHDPIPGIITAHVLGRGRSLGYGGLAGVDVLDVYDFVTSYWNVDLDRVTVTGGSMGGFGTFEIASSYPDLFAGAAPVMGGGVETGLKNLINVPVYGQHGTHDNLVAMGLTVASLHEIDEAGGMTLFDPLYKTAHGTTIEGDQRLRAWLPQQVRVDSPDRIRYTALNEAATGAYGLHILEWGPEWRPASFDAVRDDDTLYLTMDNIRVLEVDLDCVKRISVNQGLYQDVPDTDGKPFYVVLDETAQILPAKPDFPAFRLNAPGGAWNLYHGDAPILVVWGTQGDDETNANMKTFADRLRSSSRPLAPEDNKDLYRRIMMYGQLYGKPDTEVTDADIATHHLVIIGTAGQNLVARRLAGSLPVTLDSGVLRTNDGVSWPVDGRGWSLTHYNPVAPDKLVLWLASETPSFYRPGTCVLNYARWSDTTADLIIADAEQQQLVALRCFDTRWNWSLSAEAYLSSPLLAEKWCSEAGNAALRGECIMETTGADATIIWIPAESDEAQKDEGTSWAYGASHLVDVARTIYREPLTSFTMTSQELAGVLVHLKQEPIEYDGYQLHILCPEAEQLEEICFITPSWAASDLMTVEFEFNDRLRTTGDDLANVLKRTLPRMAADK